MSKINALTVWLSPGPTPLYDDHQVYYFDTPEQARQAQEIAQTMGHKSVLKRCTITPIDEFKELLADDIEECGA